MSRRLSSERTKASARPGAAKAKASDGLGPRLRVAREQSAVTVRELARRNGVSPSLVSQVERGLAMASVGTLLASANELSLDIGDLFMHGERHGERHGVRTAQAGHGPVQRRSSRKAICMASGVRWERLIAAPDPEGETPARRAANLRCSQLLTL